MFGVDSYLVYIEDAMADFRVWFGCEDYWYKVICSYTCQYLIHIVGSETIELGYILRKFC